MKFILIILYMGFLISNFIFCMYKKYLLVMLMMMEFMVLNIFFLLNLYLNILGMDYFFLLSFLVVVVCEGVLGISIMVNMLRMYGMDYFCIYNLI